MASEESQAAKDYLAKLEADFADLNKLLEPSEIEANLEAEQLRKEDEIRQLRIDIDDIVQRRKQFQTQKFDVRRQIRQAQFAVDQAAREVAIAEENELLFSELAAKIARFDELTKDAVWRNKPGGKLFKHQFDGAHFMGAASRVICADEMGLGKTRQTIAALDMMQAKWALIVAPGDLMTNWERELNEFAPEYAVFIMGKMSYERQLQIIEMIHDVDPKRQEKIIFLLNYESWARSDKIIKDLQAEMLDTMVFDEAHQMKNGSSKKFKGMHDLVYAKNKCPVAGCNELLFEGEYMCVNKHVAIHVREWDDEFKAHEEARRSVKNVIVLTGTPIMNKPQDMWTLLNLINKDLFPNVNAFERMFCETDFYTGDAKWRAGGQRQLAEKIKGFYIRRTKQDAGIKLPPQHIIIHEIEFNPEDYPLQHKMLDMLKTRAQIAIDEGRVSSKMQLLALITRQRQAIAWPGGIKLREPMWDWEGNPVMDYTVDPPVQKTEIVPVGDSYRESIKLDKACELVDELNAMGHRVVIVSQFKTVLEEFVRRQNIGAEREHCARFDGDTDRKLRELIRQDFDIAYDQAPRWQNIAMNFKTGGVGLNLTKATAMVIIDEYWNPGGNDQAYGRIDRMGQTKETSVHILRVENSIDQWMEQLVEQKRDLVNNFDSAAADNQELIKMLRSMFDR